ncbi:MAG: DUF951 domain-containing protein [Bacilli bacterium]|jgi:hypothetical protein|nr:DUF951 domain-containing protein [Bacilli bacterium]
MKEKLDYQIYDIVEMKKAHPCFKRSKLFQIVRLGADIKIMCLGCGAYIMLERFSFEKSLRKIIRHENEKIIISK